AHATPVSLPAEDWANRATAGPCRDRYSPDVWPTTDHGGKVPEEELCPRSAVFRGGPMLKAARPLLAGLAAVATLCASVSTTALPSAEAAQPTTTPTSDTTVTYRGYQVQVPRTWRVVDLRRNPRACVRFDRPAVYL